jgi:plastocyanin
MKMSKLLVVNTAVLLLVAGSTGCDVSMSAQSKPSVCFAATTSTAMTVKSAANTAEEAAAAAVTAATNINTVDIQNYRFQPLLITINKGETVTWTNHDSVKQDIVGRNYSSALIGKGESFSHTFNETGIFDYKCSVISGMLGTIIVK